MKRRYVVCGVSGRAIGMWIKPIYNTFKDCAELVGMLDIDPQRFVVCKRDIPETENVPTYMPDEYDKMIEETKPDAVFVVSKDCFHAHYIIKSLEKGLDVKQNGVYIGHTDAPELAAEVGKMLQEKLGEDLAITYVECNPTAGSHAGPNGVGVCFHAKMR